MLAGATPCLDIVSRSTLSCPIEWKIEIHGSMIVHE
jgi:hypothetical protein